MTTVSTTDLILAKLGEGGAGTDYSLPDLTRALGLAPDSLSDRIELVSALERLDEEGLVDVEAPDDQRLTGDSVRVRLADGGVERAKQVRSDVASTVVEVVGGDGGSQSLSTVADDLGQSLVATAADLRGDVVDERSGPTDRFVGRTDALDRLQKRLGTVREGTGRAAFLAGPPGVGKTAVVEEFLDGLDGAEVYRSRGRGDGGAPYHPLRDALPDSVATELFSAVGPAVEDPQEHQIQQRTLFNDLFEAFSPEAGQTGVLVVEDLHRADPGTLSFLDDLLSGLADRRLLVLGSYRPAELSEAPGGAEEPRDVATTIEVAPFEREETERLIERELGQRGIPDAFVAAIHERTGGNPLFVEETVRALEESDRLAPELDVYPDAVDDIDLPDELKDVVDHRVAQYPEPARELLTWASVLGERFRADLLASVTDLSPTRFRTYLELFVDASVFERAGDHVEFRSNVVREALLGELSEADRRRRHEAVAETLEAEDDDRAAAVALHHDWADNTATAIEWYCRAAQEAADVYATELAIDRYHDALKLARSTDDQETVIDLLGSLAEVYVTLGEYEDARRHVEYALDRVADDRMRQRLLALAARVATERGEYDRTEALVEEGLDLVAEPTPAGCRLLGHRSRLETNLGNYDDAREAIEDRIELAERVDERRQVASGKRQLGTVAIYEGAFDRAREHLQQSIDAFEQLGDEYEAAKARQKVGHASVEDGSFDLGREALDRALETFEAVGAEYDAALCRQTLGHIVVEIGDYDAAQQLFEQAIATYRDVGARHDVAKCLQSLGTVDWRRGDYATAREHHQRSLEIAREIDAKLCVANSLANLANVEAFQSNYERAREALEEALERFRKLGSRHHAGISLMNLADVLENQSKTDLARKRATEAIDVFEATGSVRHVASCRYTLARVELQGGNYDRAEDLLDRAVEAFQEFGASPKVARCRLVLGELARRREDLEEAERLTREALETFEAADAVHELAESHRHLGTIALDRDDYGSARERFRTAIDVAGESEITHVVTNARYGLARIDHREGNHQSARERSERALDAYREMGVLDGVADAYQLLVECATERDDHRQALSWCQEALDAVDRREAWFRNRREELEASDGG